MTFEDLGKDHLNTSDHASPSIIALDIFYAFSIRQPECCSEYKQKFIGLIVVIALSQEVSLSAGLDLYLFSTHRRNVIVFHRVKNVGLELSKTTDSAS